VSYRLGKIGNFKPTFSIPTPAKNISRQLLYAITALYVRCRHLDVCNRSDTRKLVKRNLRLLNVSK
jgi:hypothetical protein